MFDFPGSLLSSSPPPTPAHETHQRNDAKYTQVERQAIVGAGLPHRQPSPPRPGPAPRARRLTRFRFLSPSRPRSNVCSVLASSLICSRIAGDVFTGDVWHRAFRLWFGRGGIDEVRDLLTKSSGICVFCFVFCIHPPRSMKGVGWRGRVASAAAAAAAAACVLDLSLHTKRIESLGWQSRMSAL